MDGGIADLGTMNRREPIWERRRPRRRDALATRRRDAGAPRPGSGKAPKAWMPCIETMNLGGGIVARSMESLLSFFRTHRDHEPSNRLEFRLQPVWRRAAA